MLATVVLANRIGSEPIEPPFESPLSPVVTAEPTPEATPEPPEIHITISCNANGGTGAPAEKTVGVDTDGMIVTFYLSGVVPTRSGYEFLGWWFENNDLFEIDNPGQRNIIAVEVDAQRVETIRNCSGIT